MLILFFNCSCKFISLFVLLIFSSILLYGTTITQAVPQQQQQQRNPKFDLHNVVGAPGAAAGSDDLKNAPQQQPHVAPPQPDSAQGSANLNAAAGLPAIPAQPPNPGAAEFQGQQQQHQFANNRQPPALQPNQGGLLADSLACGEEIARYCGNVLRTSDILILQCLQDAGDDVLSQSCQQELWNVKVNLTQDERFRHAALQYCSAELNTYPCTKTPAGQPAEQSHLVLCLVEYKNNMTNEACRSFLTRIESIMFTDFYLVGPFVRACKADVERLSCGQGHFAPSVKDQIKNKAKVIHSQGGTLECLLRKLVEGQTSDNVLDPHCRHEVLRLAEMQADDFNLDRPVFFACRYDRERLCRDVQAGNGQVFNCLMENLSSKLLSYECRETILVRFRAMQKDYKISHALVQNCQQAIVDNQCNPPGLEEQADHFFLTYLLLCLENAAKQNRVIPPNCQQQMMSHRRLLMSEAQLHPETVMDCSHDIEVHCQQLRGGGETLHCLMGVAKRGLNNTHRVPLSDKCYQAINKLLQVVDVGSNYAVDQVLYRDCKGIIEGICKKEAATESDVLSCLMDNVESPQMSDECEERLLEIQYFLARDFSLDPQLYKACKEDAEKKCHHTSYWVDGSGLSKGKNQPDKPQGADAGYLVLTCLYRHAYVDLEDEKGVGLQLAPQCTAEVHRVMRERAVSVHLLPQMEQMCLKDLAEFCSQSTKPGEELQCLQDKFDQLGEKCRAEVKQFTALQSKDSMLDRMLTQVCRPVIKRYCQDLVVKDMDGGEVTECLIAHRGAPEMNHKCDTYVNHIELLSMKDVEFSFKFTRACKREIAENKCLYAGNAADKLSVIRCLSEAIIKRTLLNEGPKIGKECRKQMRSENFKMEKLALTDWFKADPQFVHFCKADLSAMECDRRETIEDAMECLKERKLDLNSACRKYIFRQERLQFGDNTFDSTLNAACAREIRQFCLSEEKAHVLHCLVKHKQDPEMTGDCLQVVQRRQREQASDIRLQPVLYEQCLTDIKQYCPADYQTLRNQEQSRPGKQEELEAKLVTCLREALVNRKMLKPQCQQEVKQIIYASEIDPKLDPHFYSRCKSEIKRLCDAQIVEGHGHQALTECMKAKFRDHLIADKQCVKEMERRVKELLFDVHLDESLYEICQLDVKQYCYDVTPGNGNQLRCLLMASQSSNVKMTVECKNKLLDRQLLWKSMNANDLKLPEGLADFAQLITTSPSKNYIQTVLLVIILVIFAIGLCFGRVTKRIRREMKNR